LLAPVVVDGLYFICTISTSQQDVTDNGGTSVLSNTKIL